MELVFLATLGKAPAVVTESLWALRQRPKPWVPDRVELVTTLGGAEELCRSLLIPDGPLATIYPDTPVPPVQVFVPLPDILSPTVRHVSLAWSAASGVAADPAALAGGLADVSDETAAACMGDLILDRVNEACRDPDNQLHLSISGGRKTMSAHALFSLGLVGNPQDEASHVLIGGEFDTNRRFFHPDQGGLIHTVAVQIAHRTRPVADWPAPTLDPREAAGKLRLFAIAAPRYDAIARRGRTGAPLPRLSTIIDQMNLAGEWRRAPRLVLDVARNTAIVCGRTGALDLTDFTWLRLLATAAEEGWTSAQDIAAPPPGALSAMRLLSGAPGYARLRQLRLWFDHAVLAALRGTSADRKAAERLSSLTGSGGSRNLKTKIDAWLAVLAEAGRRGPASLEARTVDVAAEIMTEIASFTKLRDELAKVFGLPLAGAMLPRPTRRPRRDDGLSLATYGLAGAAPGFLTVTGPTSEKPVARLAPEGQG